MVQLFGGEPARRLREFGSLGRSRVAEVKKVGGGDFEVFANEKETLHGGERSSALDIVDIARILPDGQAHLPGGNAPRVAQIRQPSGKS